MRVLANFFQYSLLAVALAHRGKDANKPSDRDPCGIVGEYLKGAAPTDNKTIIVPGQLAQDCLLSLPFNPDLASKTLHELRRYLAFQSSLDILKDPPKTYASEAVDLLGGLEVIAKKHYNSQYEFDLDLRSLIASAHDGHLSMEHYSLQTFLFAREAVQLVSVSKDGLALPKLYLYTDIAAQRETAKVSSIRSINGQNPVHYVQQFASSILHQDPDARWNDMMHSTAPTSDSRFPDSQFWPGANSTIIKFHNGSSSEFKTVANLQNTKINFTTSQDVFNQLYSPSLHPDDGGSEDEENKLSKPDPPKPNPKGYPKPFVRDSQLEMLGFNLDSETAVMLIPNFGTGSGGQNYSATIARKATEIVTRAKASGRKRLIIDISSNGGGEATRYLDIFFLLFPHLFPYEGLRFRRSSSTSLLAKFLASSSPDAEGLQIAVPLDYQRFVRPGRHGRNFTSTKELLGKGKTLGMNVSALHALNLTTVSTPSTPIRGFGAAVGALNATLGYKPEDVLIVGDGVCGSACAAFVDALSNVAGVRTVVFGGRPRFKPMQAMGAVRGGQVVSFESLASAAVSATRHDRNNTWFTDDDIDLASRTLPGLDPSFKLAGSLTMQNEYNKDDSEVPLQFSYQAAECRLFYTAENIVNATTIWSAAKKAVWEGDACVPGSKDTKHKVKARPGTYS